MKKTLLTLVVTSLLATSAFAGPIHDAANRGDIDAVKTYLASGVDVDLKSPGGVTPLHRAAVMGHKEIVELLIAYGANVNNVGLYGGALHSAANGGHKEIVELLIDKGADVNAKGDMWETPLHIAAEFGHNELAGLLIEKGANVNAQTSDGTSLLLTPLDKAIKHKRTETVEYLRERGAKTAEELRTDKPITIHEAAADGNIAAIKNHLDAGTNINLRIGNGTTPLHWAAFGGHKEVVKLLIAKGASVNAKTNNEDTPLDWAKMGGKQEIADLLREHGGKTSEELKALAPPDLLPYIGHLAIEIVGNDGTIGNRYDVEYSNNNQTWKKLETITLVMSPMVYLDKTGVGKPRRFYRIKLAE